MTDLRTSAFLDLCAFATGRALFALRGTRGVAERLGDAVLLARIDTALAAAAVARETERRGTPPAFASEVVRAADDLDHELLALDRTLVSEAHRYKRKNPALTARIEYTRHMYFPDGVQRFVGASIEAQLGGIMAIARLSDSAGGRKDPQVVAVVDAINLRDDLSEVAHFGNILVSAFKKRPAELATLDSIRAARAEMQDALAAVVVTALERTEPSGPAAALRGDLLTPIQRQHDDIQRHAARRQSAPDVDPETGWAAGAVTDTVEAPAIPS